MRPFDARPLGTSCVAGQCSAKRSQPVSRSEEVEALQRRRHAALADSAATKELTPRPATCAARPESPCSAHAGHDVRACRRPGGALIVTRLNKCEARSPLRTSLAPGSLTGRYEQAGCCTYRPIRPPGAGPAAGRGRPRHMVWRRWRPHRRCRRCRLPPDYTCRAAAVSHLQAHVQYDECIADQRR